MPFESSRVFHRRFRFLNQAANPQQEFRGAAPGEINRHHIILYDVMRILVLTIEFTLRFWP